MWIFCIKKGLAGVLYHTGWALNINARLGWLSVVLLNKRRVNALMATFINLADVASDVYT